MEKRSLNWIHVKQGTKWVWLGVVCMCVVAEMNRLLPLKMKLLFYFIEMWIVATFEISVLFLEKKKLCMDFLNLIFLTKLYNTKYTFHCTFTLCNASLKQTPLLRCPSHYFINLLLSCQQLTVPVMAAPGDWSCSLTSCTSHYPAT